MLTAIRWFANNSVAANLLMIDRGFIKSTVEVYSGELSFCYAGFDARIG